MENINMATYPKQDLINMLKAGELSVTFTKKTTGEKRVMRCTLDPTKVPGGVTTGFDHGDSLSVYDLEKNDWRSFVLVNVKDVKAA
jgi:hypothetical protein